MTFYAVRETLPGQLSRWQANKPKTTLQSNKAINHNREIVITRANTPGYWNLKDQGAVLPVNPYSRYMGGNNYVHMRLAGTAVPKSSAGYFTEFDHVPIAVAQLTTQNGVRSLHSAQKAYEIELCKAKFFDKIVETKFDTFTFIGEYKQTMNMAYSAARKGAKFYLALKDGRLFKKEIPRLIREYRKAVFRHGYRDTNLRKAGQITSQMKNIWLELYYGWQPLVHDLENVSEAIIDLQEDYRRHSVYATRRQTWHESTTDFVHSGNQIYYNNVSYRVHSRSRYKCTIGALFDHDVITGTYRDLFGLTLEQVPSTFWELTRLSFISDYFSNFGDVLRNTLIRPKGILGNTVFLSEKHEAWIELEMTGWQNDNIVKLQETNHWTSPPVTAFVFDRVPLGVPDLRISLKWNPEPWWLGILNTILVFSNHSPSVAIPSTWRLRL